MKNALKRVRQWVAGPAALLAALSTHGFVALIVLAVLVVVLAVWIIGSDARTARVTRMILALRGNARSLGPAATSPPSSRRRRQRPARRRQTARDRQ